jgi:hypothetical protein
MPTDQGTKSLQIELTTEIYEALMTWTQLSGSSASELVQQSLCSYLSSGKNTQSQIAPDWIEALLAERLAELESRIMQSVQSQTQGMQSLLQSLQANMRSHSEAITSIQAHLKTDLAAPLAPMVESMVEPVVEPAIADTYGQAKAESETTSPSQIRQLQIGDLVQVRDPDSPHYMERVRISAVGIIRATVKTDSGEHTFLKRDLRFVSSQL